MPDELMKDLLTVSEVARLFRVSPETVRRWCDAGRMDAVRLPSGVRRITRSEVDRVLRAAS